MADWACKNPQCKSFGAPHPNCRCGGPGLNTYAEGGEVSNFCDSASAHDTACQYFAEDGVATPLVSFDSLVPDAPPSNMQRVPDNGTIGTQNIAPSTSVKFDDLVSDEDRYGTIGQQAITALEGAGQGASFGLSSGLETALGVDPKDIAMRKAVNPGVHALGEGAGLIGSTLIPGVGEAKLLGKAGQLAVEAVGLGAAETVGAKVGAAAVRGAMENALYSATSGEVGKLLSGDPSQSVGTAAANIGLSGLLGAGAGAALAGVNPLWQAAKGDKLTKEMGNFVSRIKEGLAPDLPGTDHPFIDPFKPRPTAENSIGAKLADKLVKFGLDETAGKAAGATVGGMLGHTLGLGGFGALIGEHTLAPFFTKTLPIIAKKLLEAGEISANGIKAAAEYTGIVSKGEYSLDKAVKNVFKSGLEVSPNMASDRDRERLDKALQKLQTDQTSLLHVGGDTDAYLDGHGQAIGQTAVSAVNYLNSLRPNTQGQSPLDPKMPVSKVQQNQYNRALDLAEKPLEVINMIRRGTVSPTDLQTLKTLYPGLYSRMSEKLTAGVIDAKTKGTTIPYPVKMSLSMFLAQPLDSTMTPAAILAAQGSFMNAQGGQQGDSGGGPKKSTSSLSKLPAQYQTIGQAAEQHRTKQ